MHTMSECNTSLGQIFQFVSYTKHILTLQVNKPSFSDIYTFGMWFDHIPGKQYTTTHICIKYFIRIVYVFCDIPSYCEDLIFCLI